MNTRLTDRQLVILSAAGARDDRCVLPPPASLGLNASATALVMKSLIARNLVEECPAGREQEIWRRTDGGEALTLVITPSGLDAIGIDPGEGSDGAVIGEGATNGVPVDRQMANPARAKKITADRAGKPTKSQSAKRKAEPSSAGETANDKRKPSGTKIDATVKLLRRRNGATIGDLMDATGWQAHSVRGCLSAVVRKRLGLTLVSATGKDGVRRYRIEADDRQAG